ncbi:MAG TPA: efflux RND transporter permease subunit, partial [Anaerolineales bacterium]
MIRSILGSSLKFQFLVITVAAALLIFGAMQLREMPVDTLPEFSPPYVEIQTEALGLSAEEVEQMITVPMEQDLLAGVAWLDVMDSRSVPGLSSVVVHFEPGTDLYQARQMVAERIAQSAVGLPHVSKPPTMIQPLSSASRFMIVGLSSRDLSLIDLSVLARWTIAPRLMGVPGVAHVAIWGNRDRQLQVLVDPKQLQAKDVSLDQIVETTGNALWVSPLTYLEASSPGSGGFIDTPNQRLTLWHVLPISSPEELAQVPVQDGNGLLLSDVAKVVEDHQPLIGDALVNDTPNLLLVIEKLPEVNTLEVTREVETALGALQQGLSGVKFDATLFRPASFIEQALGSLTQSLVIAVLLMVLVLGLLLYGWRSALISLAAILASMLAALVVLYLRGASLNAMVLAGLAAALGIVVDEAVIDVDHALRNLRRHRAEGDERPAAQVILDASAEMRSPILFATMIVLLAVVPVSLMDGTYGALFRPLTVSYALAVAAAMAAALTITPALSAMLLSGAKLSLPESPLVRRVQDGYGRFLSRAVHNPAAANIAIVVFIVAGLMVVPSLSRERALPRFREPYLGIQVQASPATSRPEMDRIMARMTGELRAIPGVMSAGAHVGRAVFGDQVVGINSAELWVSIDPQA